MASLCLSHFLIALDGLPSQWTQSFLLNLQSVCSTTAILRSLCCEWRRFATALRRYHRSYTDGTDENTKNLPLALSEALFKLQTYLAYVEFHKFEEGPELVNTLNRVAVTTGVVRDYLSDWLRLVRYSRRDMS